MVHSTQYCELIFIMHSGCRDCYNYCNAHHEMQAASQQSLVAFAAQTQRVPVTKTGKRQSLQIPLTAQLSDLPAESPRIGAQHTRQAQLAKTRICFLLKAEGPFLGCPITGMVYHVTCTLSTAAPFLCCAAPCQPS